MGNSLYSSRSHRLAQLQLLLPIFPSLTPCSLFPLLTQNSVRAGLTDESGVETELSCYAFNLYV